MKLINLLRGSFRILNSHKLLWLLGALGAAPVLLPPQSALRVFPIGLALYLQLGLIVSVLAMLAMAGFAHTIWSVQRAGKYEFREIMTRALNVLVPILLFNLLMGVLIVCGAFAAFVIGRLLPGGSTTAWLTILLAAGLSGAWYYFAVCNIVIFDTGVVSSIWIGLLILSNNAFRVVGLLIVFGLAFVLLMVPVVAVAEPSLASSQPDLTLGSGWPRLIEIMQLPLASLAGRIIVLALTPMFFVTMTLAYLDFVDRIEYPGLIQNEVAAQQLNAVDELRSGPSGFPK